MGLLLAAPPKQTTLKIIDVILTIPTQTFKMFTPYEQATTRPSHDVQLNMSAVKTYRVRSKMIGNARAAR